VTNGTYTINALETTSSGIQAVRIPVDSYGRYYWIEYRKPYGFDNFAPTDPVVNGVSIRIVPGLVNAWSLLLDMTPETPSFVDSSLLPGHTFSDTIRGITVKTLSRTTDTATISVTFGAVDTCTRANPSISISPDGQWGNAGATLNYTVTVINNDFNCNSSTFSVVPTLPGIGWTQNPSSKTLTLNSGASTSFTIAITSPSTASEGYYNFTEKVTNTQNPTYYSSDSANYNIFESTPPVITVISPQNGGTYSRGQITISATASDASGIAQMQIFADNVLKKTCTLSSSCSYRWNAKRAALGQHTIKITATDNSPAMNYAESILTIYFV
jgi:hypothetical protein